MHCGNGVWCLETTRLQSGRPDERKALAAEKLETSLRQVEEQLRKQKEKSATAAKLFEALLDPVITLFTRLGCDRMFGTNADDDIMSVRGHRSSASEAKLPPMFASSGMKQVINSGISTHNLSDVRECGEWVPWLCIGNSCRAAASAGSLGVVQLLYYSTTTVQAPRATKHCREILV